MTHKVAGVSGRVPALHCGPSWAQASQVAQRNQCYIVTSVPSVTEDTTLTFTPQQQVLRTSSAVAGTVEPTNACNTHGNRYDPTTAATSTGHHSGAIPNIGNKALVNAC